MSRHFRRLVSIACALAALATFSAVPASAKDKNPTVNFTQNTGTVTVTWGGEYEAPILGLYPEGTACPTAQAGYYPAAPVSSITLSKKNSEIIVSLSTSVISPGWSGTSAPVTSGTYSFCMYNNTQVDPEQSEYMIVNASGWVGTVSAAGSPGSSDPSLPAPPGAPVPPGEDDPSSVTPTPQRVTPSFTG